MISKVRHLVHVTIEPLSRRRFDALGGYARDPKIPLIFEELEWYSAPDERVLGTLVRDYEDQDFGWVILARDERLRYRAIDVNSTLPDLETAREQLFERITAQSRESDESYHQSDSPGRPIDFFTAVASNEKLHPLFKVLTQAERYTPARGIIEAMMRWYTDVDGNFIEQFQTTGFNARIWELYLFATFVELSFVRSEAFAVPDFLLSSPLGAFGLEATTVNPPGIDLPTDEKGLMAFMENFIPIKIGRALRAKLEWRNPYWELPQMKGLPFVLAVQDFHFANSMQMVTSATTEYVFGVRHSLDDELKIEWIDEHVWGDLREKSGFFKLPGAENVSAVVVNPQGTLPKFNRMGYLAGFGNRRIRMVRTGVARGERNTDNPMPRPFMQRVHDPAYSETWVEGMVVLHNPYALIPLDPELIPGASHEFLRPDGRIFSLVPEFHPLFSLTQMSVG